MYRLLLKCVVFTLGVVLAFGLAYGTQVIPSASSYVTGRPVIEARNTTGKNSHTSNPSRRVIYAPDENELAIRALPLAKQLVLLKEASDQGSIDSLQLLRSQRLQALANYQAQILPVLKQETLKNVLSRFTDADWTAWNQSETGFEGGPTAARAYVDNISLVNAELGKYLETAAQLFHRLYVKTLDGSAYNEVDDLTYVISNAEKLLVSRTSKAVPARALLDPTILDDQGFIAVLEKLRGELVIRYISHHPNELERHFELLLSLRSKNADPNILKNISSLLRRFALEASAKFRENIFKKVREYPSLTEFVKADPKIRKSLAELYLVGVVDALESKDKRRAVLYLNESISLQPGLKSQEIVAESLKRETDSLVKTSGDGAQSQGDHLTAAAADDDHPAAAEDEDNQDFLKRRQPDKGEADGAAAASEDHSSGMSILSMVVLVAFFGGIGFLVVLYRRGSKLTQVAPFDHRSDGNPGVKMTSPAAMDFGDDQDIANRSRFSI